MQVGMLFMNKMQMKFAVRAYILLLKKNFFMINPRVKVEKLFASVMS